MPRRTEDLEIRMIEEAIATIEHDGEAAIRAVSYTHLTLPTIYSV